MAELIDMPDEDRAAIRDALLAWKADGVAAPLIPLNVDLDGDGVFDTLGLDENDELVLVSGVALSATVYQSTGDEEGQL